MVQETKSFKRVAALYDIHGNLPALEAVWKEIHRLNVDLIVIGGDVIPGPMPAETIDYLLHFGIPTLFISGNGEREILAHMAGQETGKVPENYRESMRWVAQQVNHYQERLASWPGTLRIKLSDLGEVLFCHATPRSDTEVFTRLTPEERLLPIFEEPNAPVIICGHTHMQFDRMIGKTRVVNAGSVGMPFQEPGAYWLLLTHHIELKHTAYDLSKAAERVRNTKYPQAEDFAANNILQTPSEQQMLELFGKVELK